MGIFNQHYTGADPSFFPAPTKSGKSEPRGLARPVMTIVILSMAITAAMLFLLWQAPSANLTPGEILAQKPARPVAHLAVATQEPEMGSDGHRHRPAAGTEGESERTHTAQSQPSPGHPQLREIILDKPPLLPPFPTEQELKVGTPRARLVRAFGRPDLSARTMQQQRLIEIYVYERPDQATFVLMQDGRVASAYTGQPQRVRVLPSEPEPEF